MRPIVHALTPHQMSLHVSLIPSPQTITIMTDDQRLAPFRELTHKPPTRASWLELTHLCEAWEDEDELEEQIIPALEETFNHWSDVQRVAHEAWIDRLVQGEFVPHLMCVRTLNLECQGIMLQDAELLAESPELQHITRLLLAYNGLQNEGTSVIANAEFFNNVYHLDLAGNSVGPPGVMAVIESPHMKNLRHLDLTGNWVDDLCARDIAQAEQFSDLEHLILRANPIREEGARALANSDLLPEGITSHWKGFM